MNHARWIKTTNWIAFAATFALFYWVVAFLTIQIFNLKVFRSRLIETFYMSLLGIFAIIGGALVLNIVSNLSRISESLANGATGASAASNSRRITPLMLLLTVPLIVGGLCAGSAYSERKKKDALISTANGMIIDNQRYLAALMPYEFTPEFATRCAKSLGVMQNIDTAFPSVSLIIKDQIEGKPVFLNFSTSRFAISNSLNAEKVEYIFQCSAEDRAYLDKVFSGGEAQSRYATTDDHYELFIPTKLNDRLVVLHFSDNARYSASGS